MCCLLVGDWLLMFDVLVSCVKLLCVVDLMCLNLTIDLLCHDLLCHWSVLRIDLLICPVVMCCANDLLCDWFEFNLMCFVFSFAVIWFVVYLLCCVIELFWYYAGCPGFLVWWICFWFFRNDLFSYWFRVVWFRVFFVVVLICYVIDFICPDVV